MTAAPGQVGATTGSGGERMGRESRFLLALLGLLAGVFVAALSMKLFVPRPPRGTGPDIHAPAPASIADLVPPPDLTPSPVAAAPWDRPPDDATPAPSRFSAPVAPTVHPPDTASADSPLTAIEPADVPTFTAITSPPAPPLPATAPPPSLSPSGAATTGENVVVPVAAVTAAAIATPAVTTAAPQNQQPETLTPSSPPLSNAPAYSPPPPFPAPPAPATVMPGQPYTVAAGDSWWGIAEQAYGDGRLYRSLFAWNRALDPPRLAGGGDDAGNSCPRSTAPGLAPTHACQLNRPPPWGNRSGSGFAAPLPSAPHRCRRHRRRRPRRV